MSMKWSSVVLLSVVWLVAARSAWAENPHCEQAAPFSRALPPSVERQTLEHALWLAGAGIADLPIGLASAPFAHASRGLAAWTVFPDDGTPAHILVYTASPVFGCASVRPDPDYHCVVMLASIVVHEAWHVQHGSSEAGAYRVQLAFLILHGASEAQLDSVHASARAATTQPKVTLSARPGTHPTP
jgi:hypothetical protein